MVVANTPQSHPDVPGASTVDLREDRPAAVRDEDRVHDWEKTQELRSGKVHALGPLLSSCRTSTWRRTRPIQDSVAVGKVTHKLKVGDNDKLEIYDYPGEYAQRFDGIDRGGGDQPAELAEDLRGQQAHRRDPHAGGGGCRPARSRARATAGSSSSGHKFTLEQHFNADGDTC